MPTSVEKQELALEKGGQIPPARQRISIPLKIAALLLVLGASLGIRYCFSHPSTNNRALQLLQTAYRGKRPLEARFSGFAYAPFINLRGGADVDTNTPAVTEEFLTAAVRDRSSIDSRHAQGLYYLAERQFDQAIKELTLALQMEEQNAGLQSDLGAALLEKGRDAAANQDQGRDVEAFAESLIHLNRALALDPNLHEALFNRALLRQQMTLDEQAAGDWRAYLEKDANSSWAEEVRQHLEQLDERQHRKKQSQGDLVKEFLNAYQAADLETAWTLLSSNREKLTAALVDAYLDRLQQHSAITGRTLLDALAAVGELDGQRVGDLYTASLARFYQFASPRQLAMTLEARDLLRRGWEFYMQSQLEDAINSYIKAQSILARVGNTCEQRMATYKLAMVYLDKTKTDQGASLFESLAKSCEASGYRWLQARALFYQSGVEFNRNEYSKAIANAEQARTEAEKINDHDCMLSAESALIEYYRLLGNQRECFRSISRSLPLLNITAFGPMTLGRHYGIMAMSFSTLGLYDAALDCQLKALQYAAEMGDFDSLSVAQAHAGLIYGKLQNFAEAFKYLDLAYAQGEAHAGEPLGQEKMAYAALQMGNLHRETSDFAAALVSYNRAIELCQTLQYATYLYQAYKGRLVCYITLDNVPAAQQQLADTLALIDQYRATIFEEENRDHFFDVEQNIYDLAINFAYSRLKNEGKAFEYAEASRARSLLDSMIAGAQVVNDKGKVEVRPPTGAQPFPLAEIQARIPNDACLLQYAVLENKLLIWIVSRDGLQVAEAGVSQTSLYEKVLSYLALLKAPSDANLAATSQRARELYDDLIRPVETALNGRHRLFIVPDKALNYLPWDGLLSPGGKYLIEDYLVTCAPSATLFAICTDLAEQKTGTHGERGLVVGNPQFDRSNFPKFAPLPDATEEAKEIAKLYPSRSLLIGPAAREQAVREELMQADVAHFALHYMVNERSVMHSGLLLTKEPVGGPETSALDGKLEVQEVYAMKLTRLRLVVLSACQTSVEGYYRGEGGIGITRAFLVARVPLVVASLWPVDSKATMQLMVRFHESRKREGLPTAAAMQIAKLSLLRGSVERYHHPFYWAAFQTVGGYASY